MINVNYSVKQRKFSFKKGKVSFIEKPVLTADCGLQANSILLGKYIQSLDGGAMLILKLILLD